MRLRILGGPGPQYMSSYLLNSALAVDAGYLGLWRTPEDQARVRHVLLTHCHIDHVASLPLLLENIYEPSQPCVVVHGPAQCISSLREHLFNDVMWPDFERLPSPEAPLLRMRAIEPEVPFQLEGLEITPVEVNHTVPAFGYLVSDRASTIVFGGDSGPTDRIWQLASSWPGEKTALVEACFPNGMAALAREAKHLTPEMLGAELGKMPWIRRVLTVHLKPRYRDMLAGELAALRDERVEIAELEKEYLL